MALHSEEAMFNFEAAWEEAEQYFNDGKRDKARELLERIVRVPVESDNADGIRAKEHAVYRLDGILVALCEPNALLQLLNDVRPFFAVLPKAKTSKMVRKLFDSIFVAGATHDEQLAVCTDMIAWAKEERRTFLRHRLEHRLALVYFEQGQSRESLATINSLLREARRLDDRSLLVDVHLLESRVYFRIKNISKSRAALVAARTSANAMYCPPLLQAEIDMQSGILHAEERDAKTAYSYLYEAFEGFHQLGDHARESRKALRYMILAKIATDSHDELAGVLQSKSVLEYRGRDMDALRGIAEAYKKQDTHQFNKYKSEYSDAFEGDEIAQRQLADMYDGLLEKHLLRIIQPYQRVQLGYLAELLLMDVAIVEARISQMILDKKLSGIVDQQHSCLIVFDDHGAKSSAGASTAASSSSAAVQSLYGDALQSLESLDRIVTVLFDKVAGKFDRLVEENIAKRKGLAKDKKGGKDKKGEGEEKDGNNKSDEKKEKK